MTSALDTRRGGVVRLTPNANPWTTTEGNVCPITQGLEGRPPFRSELLGVGPVKVFPPVQAMRISCNKAVFWYEDL